MAANGAKVWYRGRRNLDAMLGYLRDEHSLGAATEVLLGGGSAGGLSAYIHADYIRSGFGPGVKFKAAPVSGFFLDHGTASGAELYPAQMRGVYAMMNSSGGVNRRCRAAMAPDDWRCIFAQNAYAHTATAIFPLNSAVDAYQMGAILQVPGSCAGLNATVAKDFSDCNSSELAAIIQFEDDFVDVLQGTDTFNRCNDLVLTPIFTASTSAVGTCSAVSACGPHITSSKKNKKTTTTTSRSLAFRADWRL